MNEALLALAARAQVLFSQMEAERDSMDRRIKEMQNLEIMQGTSDEFADKVEAMLERSLAKKRAELQAKQDERRRQREGER
jgi:hypothetical protein